MTLQKDQPDGATSECPSYDRVFLGTLEAEQRASLNSSPSTPTTAGIEQRNKRTKVMTEIQVTVNPSETHTVLINCKVDIGTEVNVISKEQYDKVIPSPQHRHLPAQYRISAYGDHTIKTLGTFQLYVHRKGSIEEITFNVTEVPGSAMLSCKACEDLVLMNFNCSLETSEQEKATRFETQAPPKSQQKFDSSGPKPLDTQTHTPLDERSFLNEFSDCFQGLRTFNMKPYHINLYPDTQPVIHEPRAVPVHLQGMYKEERYNMVELGVLIPVSEPTDWVNSIVLSETTNDRGEVTRIRVCLDPRDLNKAIKREH